MVSLLVGILIGFVSKGLRAGLMVVLLYGVVMGIIVANVSYNDGAGILVPLLTLIGFTLTKIYRFLRTYKNAQH